MKIEDIENAALDCALFEDYYYNPDLQPAYIDGFTRGVNMQRWAYVEDLLPNKKEVV